MQDINERVASLETNQHNIFHQLDEVKAEVKDIHSLTASVEKIAVQMDSTSKKVDKIDLRLDEIEREPSDNYKYYKRVIIGCVLTGIVGAVLGALLALIIK